MLSSQVKVQTLSLEQFTAFEEATFDFCPGINVLIGANATGKSHIMKVIYSLLKVYEKVYKSNYQQRKTISFKLELDEVIDSKLYGVFQPDSLYDFIRYINPDNGSEHLAAHVHLGYANVNLNFSIIPGLDTVSSGTLDSFIAIPDELDPLPDPVPVIYLPAQEFLSINEGFIAAYNKRELPYDETYYDLSLALNALPLRSDKLDEVHDEITFLRQILAGEQAAEHEVVTQQNGRFYFDLPEGRLNVHLVAEGYRKIATLLYLLQNGSLTKDSVLFWDEPEANLNPKLVVKVVKALQMLAAIGMQIFVTTHDYLLSHELSLLAEYPSDTSVDIKFFALHKPNRKAGVVVEAGQTLAEIEHNPILEEFAAHYDHESFLFYQSAAINEAGK